MGKGASLGKEAVLAVSERAGEIAAGVKRGEERLFQYSAIPAIRRGPCRGGSSSQRAFEACCGRPAFWQRREN